MAAAEREGRAVRLMIVPGVNVFDAVIETALRLKSSEIHTGESETLSADDQARLLGEAWERASKPSGVDVRLVVYHPRGTTAAYHLGAHAPALRPEDFEQVHRLWLDVVRSVGPSVHHHDVVRTALMLMEHELSGPNRDATLELVRDTARPADEIAAIIRERDFGRLRDVLRNRPGSDVAAVLANLSLDQRVLVFRILPRNDRRRNLRVPVDRRTERAAARDGIRRGRRAPEQHGARRSHGAARRAPRRGDAPAPQPAHA